MTRYLSLEQVLALHEESIRIHGGSPGTRDLGLIASAVAQPQATFAGQELHPTVIEKAAALAFSLISNHGFIDGNKRVGFASLDVFLRVNDLKVAAAVDDAEAVTLAVASGAMSREELTEWVRLHVVPLSEG
jgi:death-on-curing protein